MKGRFHRRPAVLIVMLAVLSPAGGVATAAARQLARASVDDGALTVSGVVTDEATGLPVPGVQVGAVGGSGNFGFVQTDANGHWERTLQPGTYSLTVVSDDYYTQPIGAPPAAPFGGPDLSVTPNGPNVFDTQLVRNDRLYFGASAPTFAWTHPRGTPFDSMVLVLRYAVYVVSPQDWPTKDELMVEFTDGRGDVIERPAADDPKARIEFQGGGAGDSAFQTGSTTGCGFFNTFHGRRPDMSSVRVVVFLKSNPAQKVSVPATFDRSQCAPTQLAASAVSKVMYQGPVDVNASVTGRTPSGRVPGVATALVNGTRRVTARVAFVSDRSFRLRLNAADVDVGPVLRVGRNTVVVSFKPDDPTLTPPPQKRLSIVRPRHLPKWR